MATTTRLTKARDRITREGVQSLPDWAMRWVYWNAKLYKTPVRKLVPQVQAARNHARVRQVIAQQEQAYKQAQAYVTAKPTEPWDRAVSRILEWMSIQEPLTLAMHPWDQACVRQRDRLSLITELTVQRNEGNVLEIGAFLGETTARLAAVAEKYGRRMIVVDPWEPGTQNCEGPEYETFLQNTSAYRHVIDVVRASSLEPETIQKIGEMQLAFSYVDGLHTFEACLSDIRAAKNTLGIIAVDDMRWHEGTKRAYLQGGTELHRQPMYHAVCREGYLLPPSK